MIEIIDNSVQTLVLLLCIVLSLRKILQTRKREWVFLTLFLGLCFLGDVYWFLYLILIDHTPKYIYVADLSWYAAFLFLYMLLHYVSNTEEKPRNVYIAWLGPAFAVLMGIVYMVHSREYVGEILLMLTMGSLMWKALHGLFCMKGKEKSEIRGARSLHVHVLVFCFLEYTMWTISMNWMGDSLRNPYFWFDAAITLSFPLFLLITGKAVRT